MEEINTICKKINEVMIDKLKNDIDKFIKDLNIEEDIKSLICHIPNELENSYKLCLNGNIVSSMIILRSTFENMLFSMHIIHNPESINEYKDIKNSIRPKRVRNEIIENWDKYFSNVMESKEQTDIEIKSTYELLSKFVHPNCVRTTTSIIERDKEKVKVVKYLYMQNITSVILMYMDFINKELEIEDNFIYSVFAYEIICLFIYIEINRNKVKELEKYNDYMYLYINSDEIEKYKNIMEQNISQITDIEENDWKNTLNLIQESINQSKYNKKIGELNEPVIKLIDKCSKMNS